MGKKNELSNVFLIFFMFTVGIVIALVIYLYGHLPWIFFRAILFLYVLSVFLAAYRVAFYFHIKKLAEKMGFTLFTSIVHQPKITGIYKDNSWQVHYVSTDEGRFPGILRTYIKFNLPKKKDEPIGMVRLMDKHKFNKYKIIAVKKITKPHKKYLLMKVSSYVFNEKELHELMDYQLQLYHQLKKKL
ncbi:MAG: hypothetical protein KKF44_01340 [Nanoarchaeota archaeon]|nr:hypothetical protein [Nanoarchaeota archaeon]